MNSFKPAFCQDPIGHASVPRPIRKAYDLDREAFEAFCDEEWSRRVTDRAMERLRTRILPKHYQIFALYVLQEKPAREVAAVLGVPISSVYLVKHRIGTLLKKEIAELTNTLER